MPQMKDSGIGYLGVIPADWSVKKLKYVTSENSENGMMFPEESYYIGLENVIGYSNKLFDTETEYDKSIQ